MSHINTDYMIVVERSLQRISLVSGLTVLHQLNIGADVIDVDITTDRSKAVVTAFNSKQFFEINLAVEPPVVQNIAASPTFLEDVSITPDDKFAVSVDGSSSLNNLVSYDLSDQSTNFIPADAQSVAVSPNGNRHILTTRFNEGKVRLYLIDANGNLTDTGSESLVNGSPINITYSPQGNFAFVANSFGNEIVVLDTSNPNYYGEASRIDIGSSSQTIVVSNNGERVYALTYVDVKVLRFDPVAKRLTLVNSFNHNNSIRSYYGVDQMALDNGPQNTLSISGYNGLSVFSTSGAFIGTVPGVSPDGGIASLKPSFVFPINTIFVTDNNKQLVFINAETLRTFSTVGMPYQGKGVASAKNHGSVYVTSFSDNKFIGITLTLRFPTVTSVIDTPSPVESIKITPDDTTLVSVDGNPGVTLNIVSCHYTDVKYIPADAQAVDVSPNGNGHILTARFEAGKVRLYLIDGNGNLTDTGMESQINGSPINIAYAPSGNFAFVANLSGNEVIVLDTSNPNYFGVASRIDVGPGPQTVLVTGNGEIVYVLTTTQVRTYNFDPIAKRLIFVSSFDHNSTIVNYYGLDQMVLDLTETRLFILTDHSVVVFSTSGQYIGTLGITPAGGIARM